MSAAAEEYPWREQVFGDTMAAQRSTLVLASYPVLILLAILAAFVRYLWIALILYFALLLLLTCVTRIRPAAAAEEAAPQQCSRGGLSPAAIASVAPAFPYYDGAAAPPHGEVAQCAVCMETVKGGEEVRRLPACAHTFHVGCIDMWLDSHATCPVCRCHVLPQKSCKQPPPVVPVLQPPAEAPLPPV